MIYCNLEPGLVVLSGLSSYQTAEAFAVLKALFVHKKMMARVGARIPVTAAYLQRILEAVDDMPFQDPPLRKPLKAYILEVLARQVVPAWPATGVDDIQLVPDVVSPWIDDALRDMWLDSFVAAILEIIEPDDQLYNTHWLVTATWDRDGLPLDVSLVSAQLKAHLDRFTDRWTTPLLTQECDWNTTGLNMPAWPQGLKCQMVESFARRYLGMTRDALVHRREVAFEPSCYREIAHECDPQIRESIAEVVACRGYDCPRPHHQDEPIKGQPGMRRARMHKMNPPVRLHYYLTKDAVIYTLYSNGDHDRGLPA